MSRRGWVLFALMSVIWGVPYLMIKVAVEGGLSASMVVFARTAVGAVVLLPIVLWRGGLDLGLLRRHWLPITAFAAIEIGGPWFLLGDAEQHLTSSMTGLLIAASPIVAVVVGRLTGDAERLGPARLTGLAIGLAGVAVLAGPELARGEPFAIAEVLLVAVCYATAPIIAARKLQDVPSLPLTAVCLTGVALAYAPPAVLTWPDALPATEVLLALAGLALVCTALAFLVFFALIREVGPSRALVFTYVNPAVAVAAGAAVLGEPVTTAILVSFALILGGSVLATSRPRRRPASPEQGPSPASSSPSPQGSP